MIAKAVGVSRAWRLQVLVSAVHLALRGGLLFSRGLLRYAKKEGWLPGYNEDLCVLPALDPNALTLTPCSEGGCTMYPVP